jgi:hypothetical protein
MEGNWLRNLPLRRENSSMLAARGDPMLLGALQIVVLCVVGAFWIFVLWMMWKIVQGLKGIDTGVKQIAAALREKT